ncbi:MAG: class I SAM-dependent methyltransferase [Armatimonadota bacterium]
MRPSELAKMFELEDTYWWFVGRRELVRELLLRALPRLSTPGSRLSILDVGCGTGATLKALADLGLAVGVDRSPEALRLSRQRGLTHLVRADAESLPLLDSSADVVLALDLIEHISDDAAACREFARVLRPGGLLLVTVPALPWLWSQHDEALDHLRRYRAKRLRRILLEAGFTIERLSPVIANLLLPIAALRLMQRLLPRRKGAPETAFIIPPRTVNWVLTALLRLERIWLRRFSLPVGVSLFAVATRR